jgi:hypothetical protein
VLLELTGLTALAALSRPLPGRLVRAAGPADLASAVQERRPAKSRQENKSQFANRYCPPELLGPAKHLNMAIGGYGSPLASCAT